MTIEEQLQELKQMVQIISEQLNRQNLIIEDLKNEIRNSKTQDMLNELENQEILSSPDAMKPFGEEEEVKSEDLPGNLLR